MRHFNTPNKKGKIVFLPRSHHPAFSSVQSLSHVQLSVTLLKDCSTLSFPVHHQLPELAQTIH